MRFAVLVSLGLLGGALVASACHAVNGLDGYAFDAGSGASGVGGAGVGGAGVGGSGDFAISVRVEGLSTELALELNGAETIMADASGVFVFETRLAAADTYDVTFDSPLGETCSATEANGTVDSDVEVSVSCLPLVRPAFASAPAWLDYVDGSGSAPCNADNVTRYGDCIHGGERRVVYVPGAVDCDGVSGEDSLQSFVWSCDDSGPYVQLESDGLALDHGLKTVIDFAAGAFIAMNVDITAPTGVVTTEPAVWWDNPIVEAGGAPLDAAGTIYLVKTDPGQTVTAAGDRVAVVIDPNTMVTPAGGGSLEASNVSFVWLEGGMLTEAAALSATRMSVVRDIRLVGQLGLLNNVAAMVHGADISDGSPCIFASNNTGLAVEHADLYRCSRPADFQDGIGGYAFAISAAENSTSLRIQGANGFALDRATLANGANAGLNVTASSGVHVTRVLSMSNTTHGIRFDCSFCSLRHSTAALSSGSGFELSNAPVWVSNILAADNGIGIDALAGLTAIGRNWVAVSQRRAMMPIDLRVGVSNLVLHGEVWLGGSGNDCMVDGASTGITAGCTAAGPSMFTLMSGSADGMFVGKVSNDVANESDTNGQVGYTATLNWTRFDRPTRAWGVNGSPFPHLTNQGRCEDGDFCRIWDFRLTSNNSAARDLNPAPPDGNHTATIDGQTFLLDAIEILSDGIGDEDTLCENQRALPVHAQRRRVPRSRRGHDAAVRRRRHQRRDAVRTRDQRKLTCHDDAVSVGIDMRRGLAAKQERRKARAAAGRIVGVADVPAVLQLQTRVGALPQPGSIVHAREIGLRWCLIGARQKIEREAVRLDRLRRQEAHAERVAVEGDRAFRIEHAQGDMTDARRRRCHQRLAGEGVLQQLDGVALAVAEVAQITDVAKLRRL